MIRFVAPRRAAMVTALAILMLSWVTGAASAADRSLDFPPDVNAALHYLLDLVGSDGDVDLDNRQLDSLVEFLETAETKAGIYRADASFGAPSAFHQFAVDARLQQIIDYTLDANIPSFFFWPSSLRLTQWTKVDGGEEQFARLQAASRRPDAPFTLRGEEHVTITPDQHTGAYYTYDVDKLVLLIPWRQGRIMISIYKQQKPSAVGRRGWVLGADDEWSYLYTKDKGLNLKGLGWANTYMYDSFGITVYHQADLATPVVTSSVFSWVKAGWAGINMVEPRHIHHGLVRVAIGFKEVLEDPKLPEPTTLAETFSKSKDLPTPVLRKYASDYLAGLKNRVAASAKVWKEVAEDFDSRKLLDQMSREELYAVVALDYLKKILDRNPVMDSHPF